MRQPFFLSSILLSAIPNACYKQFQFSLAWAEVLGKLTPALEGKPHANTFYSLKALNY